MLERQLVRILERAVLDRLHPAQGEQQEDGLLEPLVDDDFVRRRVDLGDAGLALVQEVDRLLDELGGVRVGG